MRRAWGFAAVVVLVLLCAVPAAHAAFPGAHGLIAFSSNNGIETMAVDGSSRTVIGPGYGPDWSPDGQRIIYEGSSPSGYGVQRMTADGTLLGSCPCSAFNSNFEGADIERPTWTADGTGFAYIAQYYITDEHF